MTDLITLEGKAQQKGKKVVGYKFPNNLDELKFPFKLLYHPNQADGLNDNKNAKVYVKLVKNEKGDNLQSKEGDLLNLSKYSFDKTKVVISPEKLSVDVNADASKVIQKETTLNTKSNTISNDSLEQDLNNSSLGKTARKIQIGFSVVGWGVFGILAYKFWNKSMTWKVMLSVFGAYNLYNTYKVFSKPALKVESGSETETNTLPKVDVIPNNLTRSEKIDLIIKNQRGDEPADEDTDNNSKAFFNTLNDAELTIWIPLSKALKDSEISKAGQSGDKQKLYSLIQAKYGLKQQEVDEQMRKMGEFLMGSMDKSIGKSMSNSKFTGGKEILSNFESSLDLDI